MKISSYYVPPPTPPKYANSVEISTHVQGLHDFPLERRDWNVAVLLQFFREGRCFQFKYLKMFHILGGWCSSDWELILNMKTSQEYVASEDVNFSLFFFYYLFWSYISYEFQHFPQKCAIHNIFTCHKASKIHPHLTLFNS